jgi:hypothetical protein
MPEIRFTQTARDYFATTDAGKAVLAPARGRTKRDRMRRTARPTTPVLAPEVEELFGKVLHTTTKRKDGTVALDLSDAEVETLRPHVEQWVEAVADNAAMSRAATSLLEQILN